MPSGWLAFALLGLLQPGSEVALARHLAALTPPLPAGFTAVAVPPFVVFGDEAPARVRARAEHTVRWAIDRLKRDFFERDPPGPLDIWLFKDEASYRRHARDRFGEDPDTPFGYYSPHHHALVMNIATGGGTLVHELVHPYVDANFPARPPWLNEGLGSLYEQADERDGHIIGRPNWRLPGLQQAIRRGQLPSFQWLCAQDEERFYASDPGTNYAQARYLLYYLQERGLLIDFYRRFLRAQRVDPTGFATLQRVVGTSDIKGFQRRWEAFVLALRFPE
jgi:hypothetical protein